MGLAGYCLRKLPYRDSPLWGFWLVATTLLLEPRPMYNVIWTVGGGWNMIGQPWTLACFESHIASVTVLPSSSLLSVLTSFRKRGMNTACILHLPLAVTLGSRSCLIILNLVAGNLTNCLKMATSERDVVAIVASRVAVTAVAKKQFCFHYHFCTTLKLCGDHLVPQRWPSNRHVYPISTELQYFG